jgi:hypothetical protein
VAGLIGAGFIAFAVQNAHATTLVGNDFQISFDPGIQTSPNVELSTKTVNVVYLSAWNESNSSLVGNNVFGQIHSQTGRPIGSEIYISNAAGGTEDTRPRMAYSPVRDSFMVVWTDGATPLPRIWTSTGKSSAPKAG